MAGDIVRERVVRACFDSWLGKDLPVFLGSFAEDIVYVESWGPAYDGISQVAAWFSDWNRENRVLAWDIKKFHHIGGICVCEWHFECDCGGNIDGFDGVSIVAFDSENKIASLREFQSKTPNFYPYA